MTAAQVKIGGSALALFLLWLLDKKTKRAPSGTVDIGVPTVVGPGTERLGNEGYWSESEIQRLIRESNSIGGTVVRDGQTGLAAPTDDYL